MPAVASTRGTGERLVAPQPTAQAPQQAPQAPAADVPASLPGRSASGNGGGITVPPLPPIPGPVAGRRPLSNEDFEEELDIPEFLRSQ